MAGNQYRPDPRQVEFLKNYLDPESDTFSIATQSAIKAKYSKEYAENITSLLPDWLSESIGDMTMVVDAQRNLKQGMNESYKQEGKIDGGVMRTVMDVNKFIAERLGKKKFSSKGEDAAEKLADNITGMKIIKEDGNRVQDKEPQAVKSG
jgi:hypothetical protein